MDLTVKRHYFADRLEKFDVYQRTSENWCKQLLELNTIDRKKKLMELSMTALVQMQMEGSINKGYSSIISLIDRLAADLSRLENPSSTTEDSVQVDVYLSDSNRVSKGKSKGKKKKG